MGINILLPLESETSQITDWVYDTWLRLYVMKIPFKMFLGCPNAPLPAGLVVLAALQECKPFSTCKEPLL
jgi:hypothetical protein